jgi:hypothetical protein
MRGGELRTPSTGIIESCSPKCGEDRVRAARRRLQHAAAIVRRRARETGKARRAHPRDVAAPAVADDADLARRRRRCPRRLDVGERVIERCLRLQRPPAFEVFGRVAQVDARLDAVEKRRRKREVPVRGIAVTDAADVAVHAEDLLHHDQRRAGALRLRAPCRDRGAIGGDQVDPVSHGSGRSLSWQLRNGER